VPAEVPVEDTRRGVVNGGKTCPWREERWMAPKENPLKEDWRLGFRRGEGEEEGRMRIEDPALGFRSKVLVRICERRSSGALEKDERDDKDESEEDRDEGEDEGKDEEAKEETR